MFLEPSLEYFIEIANELNISRAAQKLRISQQSLSVYLKNLESDYGNTLLIRGPRAKLTEAGKLSIMLRPAFREFRRNCGVNCSRFPEIWGPFPLEFIPQKRLGCWILFRLWSSAAAIQISNTALWKNQTASCGKCV